MRRLFTSAVTALAVAGAVAEVQAQEMDRRVPRFEVGVYGGGAYTTPWYDFHLESSTGGQTSRAGDGDDLDFGFGFAPIFGVATTLNLTPHFGVRLHGAYMPSALPHAENAEWEDGYPQNNYFYDLDLVLSTPSLPLFSSVLGNAYVFVGGGGLTTNIADSGLVPEDADEVVCEPGTLARGACLPLQGEYATVGQGVVGIGGDVFSLASNVGVFLELAAHVYDSPVHTGDGFVPRITVRPGAAFGVADDKYAVTTRLSAGLKFLFGNLLPPARVVMAPPPAPAPAPAPPAPAEREIRVCVVEDGAVREVTGTFNPATGDTMVAGRRFSEAYRATAPNYALDAPWFVNSAEITVTGRRYVKFGLPRVVSPAEVARIGEYEGIGVFGEAGAATTPAVVYLPVRPGCEFQPYQQVEQVRRVRG